MLVFRNGSEWLVVFIDIHPFMHIFTHRGGVNYAGRQPARHEQLGWGVLLRDTTRLSKEKPGIEPATLQVLAKPLYLLS